METREKRLKELAYRRKQISSDLDLITNERGLNPICKLGLYQEIDEKLMKIKTEEEELKNV